MSVTSTSPDPVRSEPTVATATGLMGHRERRRGEVEDPARASSPPDAHGLYRHAIRARTRMTTEGLYYLAVLAMLITGAAIRQVNLLILLAGLMLGPLVYNWQTVARSVRKLSVVRRLPPILSAGIWVPVTYEVTSAHRLTAAVGLIVEDTITPAQPSSDRLAEAEPAQDAGQRTVAEPRSGLFVRTSPNTGTSKRTLPPHEPVIARTAVPDLPPGKTTRQVIRVRFPRRGRYAIQGPAIRSRYPFGLVDRSIRERNTLFVTVGPRRGQLLPGARERLLGLHSGSMRQHNRRGIDEGEFYGLRPWRRGDSPRWIDWRSTARRQDLMVRQFERTFEPASCFLIDLAAVPPRPRAKSVKNAPQSWPPGSSRSQRWLWMAKRAWEGITTGPGKPPEVVDLPEDDPVERTLSLVTTLIGELCHHTTNRLMIAIVGRKTEILTGEGSPQLYGELVERLATIEPGPLRSWAELRDAVSPTQMTASRWCVLSSRPDIRSGGGTGGPATASAGFPRVSHAAAEGSASGPSISVVSPMLRHLAQAEWIDASDSDLDTWITFDPS